MGSESGGRKLTPVQVLYFPKAKPKAPARTTQTLPEVGLPPEEEAKAEVVAETPGGEPRRKGERGKKKGTGGTAGVTLSDEHPGEPVDGLSELAVLGHELFTRGRVSEAKAIFEGLVVSSENDAFSRTMLGTISLALGDLDRAMTLFEAALAIDPADVSALVYRGELKLEKKRAKAALVDLELALKLAEPTDPFYERAERLVRLAKKAEKKKGE